MTLTVFALRRAYIQRALLTVIVAMTALITFTLAGTLVYLDIGSTAAVHQSLAERPGNERTAVAQTRLDQSDPHTQDTIGQQELTGALDPAPTIWPAMVSGPRELVEHDDAELVLRSEPDLAPGAEVGGTGAVTVVDGQWPADDDEGALHSQAAEALGLTAGDEVSFTSGSTEYQVLITALWEPVDSDDSRWAGEEMITTGTDPIDAGVYGPLLIGTDIMVDLADTPFVRWTIAPPPDLSPDELTAWVGASASWEQGLGDSDVAIRGMNVTPDLNETLSQIAEALSAVRAAALAPLVIVGLLSMVAAWQLAHLLAELRRRETLVLVSRGARNRQVNAMVLVESLLLAVPGAGIAAVALWVIGRGQLGFDPTAVGATAAGVAVVVALTLTAVGRHATRHALTAEDASGRGGVAMTSGALLLTVAAAAFTLWRHYEAGGPLAPGTDQPDPLAVSGPGLGLLAAGILAIAVAGPLSRAVATLAARFRGFSPATEVRQASRSITLNAVPVMLLVLASATTILAAAYTGTWTELRSTSAQVSNGADVRVPMGQVGVGSNHRNIADYAGLDGVEASTGVMHSSLRLDSQEGRLTAPPAQHWEVSSAPADVLDPLISADLAPGEALAGPELPAAAESLQFEVWATAWTDAVDDRTTREVEIRTWLWNGQELVVRDAGTLDPVATQGMVVDWSGGGDEPEVTIVDPAARGEPVDAELTVDLPEGIWTLAAVDLGFQLNGEHHDVPIDYEVQVTSLSAAGAQLSEELDVLEGLADFGEVQLEPSNPDDEITIDEPLSLQASLSLHPGEGVTAGTGLIRVLPEAPTDGPVPVLTTPVWGDEILDTGTTVQVGAVHVPVQSLGTVPVVPGNPDTHAVVADLPTLLDALLRNGRTAPATNEVWMAVADAAEPENVAAAAGDLAGPRLEVQVASDGAPDVLSLPALVVFWAAALCAILLALPGVIAVAMTQLARRRGEVVVWRAVGVGSVQQARSRRRELQGVAGWAVLAGLGAGVGLAALVAPDLVRATTPGISPAVPAALTFETTRGLIGVGVIVVAVLATTWWYGRRVRAQALDTTWREEVR